MRSGPILCVGTTPASQRVMGFDRFAIDQVNRARLTLDGAAGKSVNVAKVLHALGASPVAAGFVGGDRGVQLRGILLERGIELEFIVVEARTRQCITVLDAAGGTQTELVEESAPVDPRHYDSLREVVRRRVQRASAVVLSGTLTPGGPVDFYAECVRHAHDAGALAVVDAQGDPLRAALRHGPDLVKPNRSELAGTVGRPLSHETQVFEAMSELCSQGARRVVVTDGSRSTLAFDGTQRWRIASPGVRAVNPIGSGDAFTAAVTWRLCQGEPLGEACRWGAAAGTANALSPMPGDLERSDVVRLVEEVRVEAI